MSIHRVSQTDSVQGRYIVACDSPDNGRSTYRECWGAGAKYSARAVYASDALSDAVAYADTCHAGATVYDRDTGRPVGKARLAAVAVTA